MIFAVNFKTNQYHSYEKSIDSYDWNTIYFPHNM